MSQSTAAAEAVAAMRRFVSEVQENGRVDLIEKFIHPDFIDHTPGPGNTSGGVEGVYKVHEHMLSAVTNRTMTIVHCVSDGKVVATSKILRGNQVGDLFGNPATGAPIKLHVMDFITWVDGRFKEHWATLGPIEKA